MFHFKRRTLWIIIYITIPLVIILNRLGPAPDTAVSETPAQRFSLDHLNLTCQAVVCQLPLSGAPHLQLSVSFNQMPVSQISVPDVLSLNIRQQGGFVIGTVTLVPSPGNVQVLLSFLQQWLPQPPVGWQLTGAIPEGVADMIAAQNGPFSGIGIVNEPEPVNGLATLEAPALGGEDQLAFLLWIEILKQRLAGYDVQAVWDHRRSTSYVVFNQTLSSDSFSPVKAEELEPVLAAYLQSAGQRERSAEQLHRYAVTAMIYKIPFEFFVNQPRRLSQVTVEAVDRMREFTLEQITQSAR
ncbi:hypothetical protein [Reinekea sp. G2M2-21]|uniref:hypothetical protein n=1 Tax=Reinekea sp. G2M2-21 TaxID=2788942 RepID=UPI0018ABCDFB|nr:hypothetical protein [Reinekea sp. G2M2-21]